MTLFKSFVRSSAFEEKEGRKKEKERMTKDYLDLTFLTTNHTTTATTAHGRIRKSKLTKALKLSTIVLVNCDSFTTTTSA